MAESNDSAIQTRVAAHTPGPWTVEELDQRDAQELHVSLPAFWVVGDATTNDEVVATVEQVSRERALADARLIAAAPELVGALTIADVDQIVEGIDHFVIGMVDPDSEVEAIWRPYIDKLNILRAAIVKAGDQS